MAAVPDRVFSPCPLLGFFVVFVAGIAAGRFWGGFVAACLLFLPVFAAGLMLRLASFRRRTSALVVAMLLAGWAAGALRHERVAAEQAAVTALAGREVQVSCLVGSDVVCELRGRQARWRFRADDLCIEDLDRVWLEPIQVGWYGPLQARDRWAPRPGERWQGRVRLTVGRHDRLYAACGSRGFRRDKKTPLASTWDLRMRDAREAVERRLTAGIADWEPAAPLISAMLLGIRERMPVEEKQAFINSGTIHVFAISGLHVALFAALGAGVLALFGVDRRWWGLALIPLVVAYTVLTGLQPSAVRACVMALFYFGAPFFGRRSGAFESLLATGIVVFAVCPQWLSDAGCLLSFTVMAGLLLGTPLLQAGWERLIRRRLDEPRPLCRLPRLASVLAAACWRLRRWTSVAEAGEDQLLLAAAGEQADAAETASAARRRAVASGMTGVVSISLAAWFSALPLTLHYFGRVAPAGILANLVIAPLSGLVLAASVLGTLASSISGGLAAIFNHAAGGVMMALVGAARLADRLQGPPTQLSRLPGWGVWLGYLVLVFVFFRLWRWLAAAEETWLDDSAAEEI